MLTKSAHRDVKNDYKRGIKVDEDRESVEKTLAKYEAIVYACNGIQSRSRVRCSSRTGRSRCLG
jgi:hypothetical protein